MSLGDLFKRYFHRKRGVATKVAAAKPNQADLSQLTVVKLKSIAKERGLTGYSKLNKSGLVKLLS